jgi:hypothetical protein
MVGASISAIRSGKKVTLSDCDRTKPVVIRCCYSHSGLQRALHLSTLQAIAVLRQVSGQQVPWIVTKMVTMPVQIEEVQFPTTAGTVRPFICPNDVMVPQG